MSAAGGPGHSSATGVNIFGYVFTESGVGEHTRLLVEAVKRARLPYSVVPFTLTHLRQEDRFSDFGEGDPRFDVNIVGVNADEFPRFAGTVDPQLLVGRYTIGLWAWEVEEFPAEMAASHELVDEIWANSHFSAQAIAQAVARPVFPFPLPVAVHPIPQVDRAALGLPSEFLFLFCYDFGSIFERKNPLAVISAFKLAFPAPSGPHLVIKSVNGDAHPDQLEQLRTATVDRPDIVLMDGYLERDRQRALMASCDAYVSLHRAEGFGLTLAEAMSYSRPVIATGYSGNLDFMTEDNSYLVPYELTPIAPGCGPYPTTCRWAEPDVTAAARLMRRAWENPDEARAKGECARQEITDSHGPAARAAFIRERHEAITRQLAEGYTPAVTTATLTRLRSTEEPEVTPAGDTSACEPDPGSVADQAAALIAAGPNVQMPSRLGRLAAAFRKGVLRVLQNYHLHQQQTGMSLVAAIRELEERLRTLEQNVAQGEAAALSTRLAAIRCPDLDRAQRQVCHDILAGQRPVAAFVPFPDDLQDVAEEGDTVVAWQVGGEADSTTDQSDRGVLEQMQQRPDGSAGAVVLAYLLGCVRLETLTGLLREAHRILRIDGVLIVVEENRAGAAEPGQNTPLAPETAVDLGLRAGFSEPELGFPLSQGEESLLTWQRSRYLLRFRRKADLQELRQHWEILGEEDPYWAILSVPSKRGGEWQLEEFLGTGEKEVGEALQYLERLPVTCGRERALDFGCGVGRLTRALGNHFARVDGIDISSKMLEQARVINRDRPHCQFHHVTEPCLPFTEATFDLVYSQLVLQHMSTEFALAYIAEFVRVLKPEGIALFQAPSCNLTDGRRSVASPVDYGTRSARIDMHVHPREAVEKAVVAAGGSVLAAEPDLLAGDSFESFFYAVTRA